nr:Rnase H [Caudoviricetes sp.]CAI9751685.1 Rnase H [Caudoviricetes sp.]
MTNMKNFYVPTRAEFDLFCEQNGWCQWADILWRDLNRNNWMTSKGKRPYSWKTIAGSRSEAVRKRNGFSKPTKEKVIINEIEEEFSDNGLHYVCYTDGSCDNLSKEKAGGSAYIVIKDGEIIKMKNHGTLNTTNNRMELLAIISAVNSCPQGAYVDIYTDSQYCILVLSKSVKPKKNPDLYEMYKKCSAHVAGVRFHWVKGHDGNKHNELADNLAYGAYCDICDTFGLEKSPRH